MEYTYHSLNAADALTNGKRQLNTHILSESILAIYAVNMYAKNVH